MTKEQIKQETEKKEQVSNDSKKTTRIYNHALKFSWEKTIEKYISLYKELI